MTQCQVWRVSSLPNQWHSVFGKKSLDYTDAFSCKAENSLLPINLVAFFAQGYEGDGEP